MFSTVVLLYIILCENILVIMYENENLFFVSNLLGSVYGALLLCLKILCCHKLTSH